MGLCFVIQPFDGGAFDRRYNDVIEPAIKAADLEPYRVDRDDSTTVPIESIEAGIKKSDVSVADISLNNANVWYEVGYATAMGKDVVLICSDKRRDKFPFDIRHRTIIKYTTESVSDFKALGSSITAKLKALIANREEIAEIQNLSPLAPTVGLTECEIICLIIIAVDFQRPMSHYNLRNEAERAGYNGIATALAAKSLLKRGFITHDECQDDDGDVYIVYLIQESGFDWLEANKSRLSLTKGSRRHLAPEPYEPAGYDEPKTENREIPF